MNRAYLISLLLPAFWLTGCSPSEPDVGSAVQASTSKTDQDAAAFEDQVAEYIRKFPYQDTFNYAVRYTGGDPAKLNVWVLGSEPSLVKAGEDTVVRMNNDTYYKMAFMDLTSGPVVLSSANPSESRFISFKRMDESNANFRNIMFPDGDYTLYYGDAPDQAKGEAIASPSSLAVVIVRVEVKDKADAEDTADAQKIFNGISIKGDQPAEFPTLDLLSGYDEASGVSGSVSSWQPMQF